MSKRYEYRAAFVHTLQLEKCDNAGQTYHLYIWPEQINGTEQGRFVIIEEFDDGSAAIYLDANAAEFKDKLFQMRKMANPQ